VETDQRVVCESLGVQGPGIVDHDLWWWSKVGVEGGNPPTSHLRLVGGEGARHHSRNPPTSHNDSLVVVKGGRQGWKPTNESFATRWGCRGPASWTTTRGGGQRWASRVETHQRVVCDSLGVQGPGIMVVVKGGCRGWKPTNESFATRWGCRTRWWW
jgi:hypothetical protein